MLILKKFLQGAVNIKVEIVNSMPDPNTAGLAELQNDRILLLKEKEGERTRRQVECDYCHELMHFFLSGLRLAEKTEERICEHVSNRMHQYIEQHEQAIKKGKSIKKNRNKK